MISVWALDSDSNPLVWVMLVALDILYAFIYFFFPFKNREVGNAEIIESASSMVIAIVYCRF